MAPLGQQRRDTLRLAADDGLIAGRPGSSRFLVSGVS